MEVFSYDMNGPRPYELNFVLEYVQEGSLLDIGYSNQKLHETFLEMKVTPSVLDIRPFKKKIPGIKYYISDIRETKNIGKYNNIIMISTLEHVSLDCYTQKNSDKTNPFEEQKKIIKKCIGMLEENGVLIVTVPCGTAVKEPKFQLLYSEEQIKNVTETFNVLEVRYATPQTTEVKGIWKAAAPKTLTKCTKVRDGEPGKEIGVVMFLIKK